MIRPAPLATSLLLAVAAATLTATPRPVLAQTTTATQAIFDRWMYPFNTTPGTRTTGSLFGGVGQTIFDDADAQIVVGFDTARSGIPTGLGAGNYSITSATVRLHTATDEAFVIDPTHDPLASYLATDPEADDADSDPGRPIELFGIGFRHGYTAAGFGPGDAGPTTFEETDPFGVPGPPAARMRAAFVSDYFEGTARDVSNFVRDGIELLPWAVGDVPSLEPGDLVPVDTAVEFNLDLSNPQVMQYLRDGLDSGGIFLGLLSLQTSVQGSSEGIPVLHLAHPELGSAGQIAQLEIEWSAVPEPATIAYLAALPLGLLLAERRRWRNENTHMSMSTSVRKVHRTVVR